MDAYANNKNLSFGDIFGDARYRNNQGQSMTLRRNIMGELEYSSNEFRATLGKDIFDNIIKKASKK